MFLQRQLPENPFPGAAGELQLSESDLLQTAPIHARHTVPDLQKQLSAESTVEPAHDKQCETGQRRREKLKKPLWQMGTFPSQE